MSPIGGGESIKGRFARALLRLADAFGREVGQGRIVIRQKVSQADLAAMAGEGLLANHRGARSVTQRVFLYAFDLIELDGG
jgi:hypothetical protein